MKQSLLRAPKAGVTLRGKMKKAPLPNFNPQGSPNSECLDVSFSDSPSPISIIPDNLYVTSSNSVTAAAADHDEAESSTLVEPASFIENIVRGGGSCAEEILTESSEVAAQPEAQIIVGNSSAKDEGERNLELALAGFSEAMEKLCDAIREELLPEVKQRKRRNWNDGVFFFLVRVGELTLAFFIGALLISYLILNNLSEFNGPAPT